MKTVKALLALGVAGSIAACTPVPANKNQDFGIDSDRSLSTKIAGIWVDPNGCDHWIIDDGVEGYLSEPLQPDGTPVCSGVAPPTTVVGPFQDGSPVPDIL